jgi:hypothetical protein
VHRLLVTANAVPSSPILVTLMIVVLNSSETSVLTRVTRRDIPEEAILHSHLRENFKSYKLFFILNTTNPVFTSQFPTNAPALATQTVQFHSCYATQYLLSCTELYCKAVWHLDRRTARATQHIPLQTGMKL